MGNRFTEEEEKFLIENYPKYGGRYCHPYLNNRSMACINAKAKRMGLSAKNKVVHPDLQKIDVRQFENIISKEVAYFLGFFWADGNIINYTSNNITHWRIALEIQERDAIALMEVFMKLGNWSIQVRKRKDSWQTTYSFVTNNKDLYTFLNLNGYSEKSQVEPNLILDKIPEELKIYFWRGVFDGDGSLGLMGRGAYFEISNPYDYKYTEIAKFIGDVKFGIYRGISKEGHKKSAIKVYGRNILKLERLFIDYGLKRKTEKFIQIKNKYTK